MNEEKRIRIIQIIVVSAVVFVLLLLTALIVNLVRLAGTSSRKRTLEAELNRLDAIISKNDETLDYRNEHIKEYVDTYAREYLNMIGKDEEAFIGKKKAVPPPAASRPDRTSVIAKELTA